MTLLLAGDIGGTKTILRLVKLGEGKTSFQTLFQDTYASQKFTDLVPIVQQFLATTKQDTPELGCFAIAGPVVNNTCQLTNLNWSLRGDRLSRELGMKRVSLINDFAAASYGILGLPDSDLHPLQSVNRDNFAPISVIGAGTGLGESFLVPTGKDYRVFATEGGHADFAPSYKLEFQLLEYLREKYQTDHVSVERVVSGQGIVAIYQFLRDGKFFPESPDIANAIRSWEEQEQEEENRIDPAAVIGRAALGKEDSLCIKTMEMFVRAYGAEAGNVALKLLPYGGLYIAGGIAAKILPLMTSGSFLDAFQQKGRLSPLLKNIPVNIVLNPQVGLLGSVLYGVNTVV